MAECVRPRPFHWYRVIHPNQTKAAERKQVNDQTGVEGGVTNCATDDDTDTRSASGRSRVRNIPTHRAAMSSTRRPGRLRLAAVRRPPAPRPEFPHQRCAAGTGGTTTGTKPRRFRSPAPEPPPGRGFESPRQWSRSPVDEAERPARSGRFAHQSGRRECRRRHPPPQEAPLPATPSAVTELRSTPTATVCPHSLIDLPVVRRHQLPIEPVRYSYSQAIRVR